MTIHIGQIARELRESLGLTQRAAAEELGVSCVHLCNIEKSRAAPSQALVDKYRQLWGVDLHVLAWCKSGNTVRLPRGLRKAATELAKVWEQHVDSLAESRDAKVRS